MNVERLEQRLARLSKWTDRCDRILEREAGSLEDLYRRSLAELDQTRREAMERLTGREAQLQAELEQAGKDYSKRKYQMERDLAANRDAIKEADETLKELQRKHGGELQRLNEEKLALQISSDRQRSALTDLYQEKRRHLAVTRATLAREWQAADEKLKAARAQSQESLASAASDGEKRLAHLKSQSDSKRQGWDLALETIKRELDARAAERAHLEKRLAEVNGEREKELDSLRTAMAIAREQLEIDKATLVERAEEDQRRCEADVADLKTKLEEANRAFESLVESSAQAKRQLEEGFEREEAMLKEAVKGETEKRDYEQKLFEQEKAAKEKEVARLREEYEKRKWHWDNQVRTLLMQRSVQESEHEAERLRVDREARSALRGLEARRDEIKQRLAELKTRHASVAANADKEKEVIGQRWRWRRDRLWALWDQRLATLKKERAALHEQIQTLQDRYEKARADAATAESREGGRVNELQGYLVQVGEKGRGERKQRDIQFELEKTRILAQIKECELAVSDWVERLKRLETDASGENAAVLEQVKYLERWYREEEQETTLFLASLEKATQLLVDALGRTASRERAA